jgi:hypothetical protein
VTKRAIATFSAGSNTATSNNNTVVLVAAAAESGSWKNKNEMIKGKI